MTNGLFTFLTETYPVNEKIKARILSMIKSKSYKKGEYLLRSGKISNHIFFIEEGLIRIFKVREDGVEVCSGLLCEGGLAISVKSFFDREPGEEFIQALEDTVAYYISYDELESVYNDYIEYNRVGRLIITRYYVLSEQRSEMLRGIKAKDKFALFQKHLGHLTSRVPRKDIASYLGITLETLSRLGY